MNDNDYQSKVVQIVNDEQSYMNAQSTTIATVLKAEQYNGNAAEQIENRINENNAAIDQLKNEIKNLEDSHKNTDTQITQIKNLTLQNALNIQALTVATQENTIAVTHLGAEIVSVKEDIQDIASDVVEIKLKQEWDNLPLKKQVELLKNSNQFDFYFKDQEDKTKAIQQYEAVIFRQEVVTTCNDIAAYGNVALTAMQTLHFGSPQLQSGINYALKGVGIVSAFFSGNFVACLTGVLGLFGGGGPSVEVQMLQEIQKQIDGLEKDMDKQFDAVHQHLDALGEHIDKRFDRIERELNQIGNQLNDMQNINIRNFAFISSQLTFIENQNACLQQSLEKLAAQYTNCDGYYPLAKNDSLSSITDIKMNFSVYADCIRAMRRQFGPALAGSPIFDYSACDNKIKLDQLYYDVNAMWYEHFKRTTTISDDKFVSYLIYPVNDFRAIDSLNAFINGNIDMFEHKDLSKSKFLQISNFTSNAMHYKESASIVTLSTYYLAFFPYLALYDAAKQDIIDDPSNVNKRLIEFLKDNLSQQIELCDLSIAQHMLLNGNNLINGVGEILKNEASDKNLRTLFEIIEANPAFEKNLELYLTFNVFADTSGLNKYIGLATEYKNNFFSMDDPKYDWLQLYSDTAGKLFFNIQSFRPISVDDLPNSDRTLLNVHIPVAVNEFKLGINKFQLDKATLDLFNVRRSLIQKLVEFKTFDFIPLKDNNQIDQTDLFVISSN